MATTHSNYRKVPDSRCAAAAGWWEDNQALWQHVRESWDAVFACHTALALQTKVDDKRLFEYLFEIDPETPKAEVQGIIQDFVK